jgi:hypothetical protein
MIIGAMLGLASVPAAYFMLDLPLLVCLLFYPFTGFAGFAATIALLMLRPPQPPAPAPQVALAG